MFYTELILSLGITLAVIPIGLQSHEASGSFEYEGSFSWSCQAPVLISSLRSLVAGGYIVW